MAKALEMAITQGPVEICEACVNAQAKQNNTAHKSQGLSKSTILNQPIIYLQTQPKPRIQGGMTPYDR